MDHAEVVPVKEIKQVRTHIMTLASIHRPGGGACVQVTFPLSVEAAA